MKLLPIADEAEVTSDPPERETRVEGRIKKWAEANGWWQCKFVSPGLNGVPDRLFIRRPGIVVFIEVKRPKKTPNRQQLLRHEEMRSFGAYVHWCDNDEDAIRILASYHL